MRNTDVPKSIRVRMRAATGVYRLLQLTALAAVCLSICQVMAASLASAASAATFGKTTVGASTDTLISERKRVNRYALGTPGSVSKLSMYLAPSGTSGQEVIKGLIYADNAGTPAGLLGVSEQLTFKSTNAAGWYDMTFSSPVKLTAGNYWIGVMTGATAGVASFRWTSVSGSRDYNANAYASGPTNPFGAVSTDAEQTSLYATYAPESTEGGGVPTNTSPPTISGTAQQGQTLSSSAGGWSNSPTSYSYEWLRCGSGGGSCSPISGATSTTYTLTEADVSKTLRVSMTAYNNAGPSAPARSTPTAVVTAPTAAPVNTSPPTISGTAQQGQTLSANAGSWSNFPTSYAYEWERCGSGGAGCNPISGAASTTYTLTEADVSKTLRVSVIASNEAGPSAASRSAPTAVVTPATGVSHLEYVVQDGVTSVYDMDNGFSLVKTISLPQTKAEVRGVTVAPSTHMMFIAYGGDGGGSGNGSVLAYNLVTEKVVWDVKLNTGIDSGQVSPDGTKLYIPTGELSSGKVWNVLNAANGEVTGTILGGSGPHNTVVSADGNYVYLAGRTYNYLDVYETASGKVREIGPLVNTARPFTVNGSNTLAFTTATNFDGFQVSSITTGKVLFTVSFGEVPKGFAFTAPSHGASLSPDEKQLYVIDAVHKEVQFWDVSKVKEGVAPTQIGVVPVAGLSGSESPCTYDCGRGGWLQLSGDGRDLFVGDSGEVIDTETRKVITTLSTLAQTKKSIEVDWQGGVPISTSGRTGVGGVG